MKRLISREVALTTYEKLFLSVVAGLGMLIAESIIDARNQKSTFRREFSRIYSTQIQDAAAELSASFESHMDLVDQAAEATDDEKNEVLDSLTSHRNKFRLAGVKLRRLALGFDKGETEKALKNQIASVVGSWAAFELIIEDSISVSDQQIQSHFDEVFKPFSDIEQEIQKLLGVSADREYGTSLSIPWGIIGIFIVLSIILVAVFFMIGVKKPNPPGSNKWFPPM